MTPRDEVDIFPRAALNRADVRFENFEPREFLLHHFEQASVLRPELLAEFFGRIRDVRVVVPFNCALEMVRDSEGQHAGHNAPSALHSDPLLGGKTSKDDNNKKKSYRPRKPLWTSEEAGLHFPELALDGLAQFFRRNLAHRHPAQCVSYPGAGFQFPRAGFATLQVSENIAGGLNQKFVAEIGIEVPAYPGALFGVKV